LCWWKWVGPMCIERIRLDQGHCPVARLLLSVAVPTFRFPPLLGLVFFCFNRLPYRVVVPAEAMYIVRKGCVSHFLLVN
jgi:hypothetical protein